MILINVALNYFTVYVTSDIYDCDYKHKKHVSKFFYIFINDKQLINAWYLWTNVLNMKEQYQ